MKRMTIRQICFRTAVLAAAAGMLCGCAGTGHPASPSDELSVTVSGTGQTSETGTTILDTKDSTAVPVTNGSTAEETAPRQTETSGTTVPETDAPTGGNDTDKPYDTSADTAIAVLEADGWIYDANGEPYVEGVRYKKIPAEYADENDKTYKSIDGAYVTTKVGDDYYMPLVLNWYGTTDNPFSDLLVTDFEQGANIAAAGIVIQKTTGDFNPMLDEFYQQAVYGFYSGTPMYSCFNYATGFTSAAYDYSYNWSIDPSFYENNSIAYLKDEADIYWLS